MNQNQDPAPELVSLGQPGLPGHPGVAPRPPAPAMPVIGPGERYDGSPYPLLDGVSPTIGWQIQPEAQGGPAFVILARSALGSLRVAERFPLTEHGWSQAWHALVTRNPDVAGKVRAVLVTRAAAAPPQFYPPAQVYSPALSERTREKRIAWTAIAIAVAGVLGIAALLFLVSCLNCATYGSWCPP